MRISRPCYDKFHRCPGWNGGGMHYARVKRCEGGHVPYPGGRLRKLKTSRCVKCGVIVLPWAVRWLDWTWLCHEPAHWKQRLETYRELNLDRRRPAALPVRLLARLWWHLDPTRALDYIPGFPTAYGDCYDAWAARENRRQNSLVPLDPPEG